MRVGQAWQLRAIAIVSKCWLSLQRRCDLHLPAGVQHQWDETWCIQFPLGSPIRFPELALALWFRATDAYNTSARLNFQRCSSDSGFLSTNVGVGTVAVAHSEAEIASAHQVYMQSSCYMRFDDVECHVGKFTATFEDELCEQRC